MRHTAPENSLSPSLLWEHLNDSCFLSWPASISTVSCLCRTLERLASHIKPSPSGKMSSERTKKGRTGGQQWLWRWKLLTVNTLQPRPVTLTAVRDWEWPDHFTMGGNGPRELIDVLKDDQEGQREVGLSVCHTALGPGSCGKTGFVIWRCQLVRRGAGFVLTSY